MDEHTQFVLQGPEPQGIAVGVAPEAELQTDDLHSPFILTLGQVYDGPFDLLLSLIRKQDIDIYDIPIAKITAQFLELTKHLKRADIEEAAEFIYVASMLIHIKSKMLVPRDFVTGVGAGQEDPRRELVDTLLEHERYKMAARVLHERQMLEDAAWSRPGVKREKGCGALERGSGDSQVDLLLVLESLMAEEDERPRMRIEPDSLTVADMLGYLKRRLLVQDRPISLYQLVPAEPSRNLLVCIFLGILELVRMQAIVLNQPVGQGDVLIKKTASFDGIVSTAADQRDDWT